MKDNHTGHSSGDYYKEMQMDKVYKFITVSTETYKMPIDYGYGPKLAMMEAHTLSIIGENPGITTTEIIDKFGGYHTLSAISQHVMKLIRKELVYQQKEANNGKNKHLYLTALGKKVHLAHFRYDAEGMKHMTDMLLEHLSTEDMDAFFRVIDVWSDGFIEYRQRLKDRETARE